MKEEWVEMDFSFDGGKTWDTVGSCNFETVAWGLKFSRHGSVDHYRSLDRGYRKHGNQLRIAARQRFEGRKDPEQYDYLVSQFYID